MAGYVGKYSLKGNGSHEDASFMETENLQIVFLFGSSALYNWSYLVSSQNG